MMVNKRALLTVCILLFWLTIPRYFAELTFRVFILADSNSEDLAEKNKGSLDMVPAKFGDRNVVTFLALLGKCKKYFLQIWSIYPSNDWKLDTEHESGNIKLI